MLKAGKFKSLVIGGFAVSFLAASIGASSATAATAAAVAECRNNVAVPGLNDRSQVKEVMGVFTGITRCDNSIVTLDMQVREKAFGFTSYQRAGRVVNQPYGNNYSYYYTASCRDHGTDTWFAVIYVKDAAGQTVLTRQSPDRSVTC